AAIAAQAQAARPMYPPGSQPGQAYPQANQPPFTPVQPQQPNPQTAPAGTSQPQISAPGAVHPTMQPPPAGRPPDNPPTTPPQPPTVTYRDGLLTVQAMNSTLSSVLSAIRNKAGIEFEGWENVSDRVALSLGPAPAGE